MITWMGADWDRDKCVVQVQTGDQDSFGGEVKRDPQAVREWLSSLEPGCDVVVGIEDGDRHWVRLWEMAGAQVVVFDPKKAKRFCESLYSGGASDDRRAARALLVQVQSSAHREQANQPMPVELRGLECLMRLQENLSTDVQRARSRLEDALKQQHPAAWSYLRSRLKSGYVLRVLQGAPTAQAFAELDEEAKRALFKGVSSKQRASLPQVLAEQHVVLQDGEEQAARFHIRTLANQLEHALTHYEQVTAQLEESSKDFESCSTARSVKGIGIYLGVGVTLANASAEAHRDSIATQTGVAPVTIRSGTRGDHKPVVRMRRKTRTSLRRVGYLLGAQLVLRYRWAKAQYHYYINRNISSSGAYRRLARSFSRVLYALLRTQTDFDEDRYIQALKDKGVSWAVDL